MMGDVPMPRSSRFEVVADAVFQTLLTITTILSGVYISITFGWFGQAMIEPHPGEPMQPEALAQATTGILLGVIFLLPLIAILLAWALSKFRRSLLWRTVAWSSLLYCLMQDFVGLVALFALPLIAEGVIVGGNLMLAAIVVILPPTMVGAVLGYRVSIRYPDTESDRHQHRAGVIAVLTVLALVLLQAVLLLSRVLT